MPHLYKKNIPVLQWTTNDVGDWLRSIKMPHVVKIFQEEGIDGLCLVMLNNQDIKDLHILRLGERKKLEYAIHKIRIRNRKRIEELGYNVEHLIQLPCMYSTGCEVLSDKLRATQLKPEYKKTIVSFIYSLLVSFVASMTMVVVHGRVPDMTLYPPLPDIVLDNIPYIPWAFAAAEFITTILFSFWIVILIFHQHRFILLRRFFALNGTIYLLRCVTILITSLSVPSSNLECSPIIAGTGIEKHDTAALLKTAFFIWRRAGLTIQGVHTCGDYMFSGHTALLTILNFFITEYTPNSFYFVHTLTWSVNIFGAFLILAAHEHYSIDVFIAFYISSRIFLYYHALANNHQVNRDVFRTRIWFPLFSYFEYNVNGVVPNEYDDLETLFWNIVSCIRRTNPPLNNTNIDSTTDEEPNIEEEKQD